MIYVLQSGVITATVNQEETPPRDLPCEGPPIRKIEHTHTFPIRFPFPFHVTVHSSDLALGVERPLRDGGTGRSASKGREA